MVCGLIAIRPSLVACGEAGYKGGGSQCTGFYGHCPSLGLAIRGGGSQWSVG